MLKYKVSPLFCLTNILLTTLFLSSCQYFSKQPEPLTALKITFRIENQMKNQDTVNTVVSEEILLLDLVKNRMRKETNQSMTMGTMEVKRKDLEIYDGKKHYRIDSLNSKKAIVKEVNYSIQAPWKVMNAQFQKPIREEKHLFKNCQVYELKGPEMKKVSWVWNDIELKSINELTGLTLKKEAVAIEENPTLKDSLFQLPADIEPVDYKVHQKEQWEKSKKMGIPHTQPPFKTARITYKIKEVFSRYQTKTINQKKEVLLIDAPRSKLRRVTTLLPQKGSKASKDFQIISDGKLYRWKSKNPKEVIYREFFSVQPWKTVTLEKNFKKNAMYLGKKCKVYEAKQSGFTTRTWVWAQIELKSVISHKNGTTKKWATKIKEDLDIDPNLFIPPASVALIHQDEKNKIAQQKMKEFLDKNESKSNK